MILLEVPGDDARLAVCQRAYFAEISDRFGVQFDPYAGESDDVADSQHWHVLVLNTSEAIGCGSLRDLGGKVAEVKRVWVSQTERGKGVAHVIMNWLETKATDHSFTTIRLDTNNTLGEAQAMYSKRGYREIGRYNDNPFADHFYEKQL